MKRNEGFLGKHSIGGDEIYTKDHTPILLSGKLKSDHGEIKAGSVLTLSPDGELDVIKASNTLPLAGVSVEDMAVGEEQPYISYLAHGTVKSEMLKGSDGGAFTDFQKLQISGVYAI